MAGSTFVLFRSRTFSQEVAVEIETKRASLDTMSVTIQALHVSGKQMTLAVFRQLPAKVLP